MQQSVGEALPGQVDAPKRDPAMLERAEDGRQDSVLGPRAIDEHQNGAVAPRLRELMGLSLDRNGAVLPSCERSQDARVAATHASTHRGPAGLRSATPCGHSVDGTALAARKMGDSVTWYGNG